LRDDTAAMPVILYRDPDYEGPSVRLQPGFHTGRRALEGAARGATNGEDLSREASSVRVDDRYVAVLYGGMSDTASSGARTLVGPAEIPDLGAVGMDDKTASVQVYLYAPHLSAVPRDFGVTLYSSTGRTGMEAELGQGDYNQARLKSDEVRMRGQVQSLCVGSNTLAILYAGGDFESTEDSVVVAGPRCIDDVDSVGMYGDGITPKIRSIRVLYAAAPTPADAGSIARGLSAGERAVRTLGRGDHSARVPGSAYSIPVTADARAGAARAAAASDASAARRNASAARRDAELQQADQVAQRVAESHGALNFRLVALLLLLVVIAITVAAYATVRRRGGDLSQRQRRGGDLSQRQRRVPAAA